MTLVDFVLLLCIAGLFGALGQALAGQSRGGCILSLSIGFVGAIAGVWTAWSASLPPIFVVDLGGGNFPVFWAIVGSALFVAVLRMLAGRRTLNGSDLRRTG